MASGTRIFYFRGIGKWCKVHTPDKTYGNYTLDLYPDELSWELYNDSGLDLKKRENEDGTFIKLRREPERLIAGDVVNIGGPKVWILDSEGNKTEFTENIGNGSRIVCKVSVYQGRRGVGHRLEEVLVEDLVEYKTAEVVNEEIFPF